ncbi:MULTISPECIES: nuclease-related domain-containing protein [Bhargavaea]|uniref:Nuclease-related domain-containing protein n=1 Tax=Bhargavaea changchunensis TaxID=2134037 RepID=A0ABW2NHT3_9BACL|nr:nuclease-related domain-containing protein [Bhargavaea sp. CC-171006]
MGERPYPLELLQLESMLRRLHRNHRERDWITDRIKRVEAGFSGEQKVDQYMKSLRLPGNWWILRDIRLRIDEAHVAQFDTLLVTDNGIVIIEAKMIKGTLHYLENPRRLERTEEDGSVLTFDCPMIQLENQKEGLSYWLRERELITNIKGIVAFATRNTWIGLPERAPFVSVKELPYIPNTSVNMIVSRILEEELGPERIQIDQHYGINPHEFKRGLLCEKCDGQLRWMTRRKLECPTCGVPAGNPYQQALLDDFLLIDPVITTRAFCEFTGIPSISTGLRHLNSVELDVLGSTNKQRFRFDPMRHLKGKTLIQKR